MKKFDNLTLRILLFLSLVIVDLFLAFKLFKFEPILSHIWIMLSIYCWSIFPYKKWFKKEK